MATQNPIEQEGTYPLPEAQMDRFLMHVYVTYPEEKSERDIMLLVRGEEADEAATGAVPGRFGLRCAGRAGGDLRGAQRDPCDACWLRRWSNTSWR